MFLFRCFILYVDAWLSLAVLFKSEKWIGWCFNPLPFFATTFKRKVPFCSSSSSASSFIKILSFYSVNRLKRQNNNSNIQINEDTVFLLVATLSWYEVIDRGTCCFLPLSQVSSHSGDLCYLLVCTAHQYGSASEGRWLGISMFSLDCSCIPAIPMVSTETVSISACWRFTAVSEPRKESEYLL